MFAIDVTSQLLQWPACCIVSFCLACYLEQFYFVAALAAYVNK